jgi:DNA-directed RNA polymerase specialized sigma subunit
MPNKNNVWMNGTFREQKDQKETPPSVTAYDNWMKVKNPENTSAVLKELKPTIESAMTSYAPDVKNNLRTRANLMALNSLELYDPNRGTKLTSHVFNHLKGLNREKARRFNVVHIPENVILEGNKLNKAKDIFDAEHGREPTVQELADNTGLSIKRIEAIETKGKQQSGSQLLSEKGDSLFSKAEDPQRVWADYIYHDLDTQDKKVFEWSTGYGGTKKISKTEIAKRLKISPAAVSRRISKIVYMLEQGYDV